MIRNLILSAICLCLFAATAPAQDAAPSQPTPPRGNRPPGGPQGRGDMVAWFLRDAEENVSLSGQQTKQLQESLNKLRDEAMSQFRNNPPNPEMWQTMRALRQQQEQAATAGDDAKVREIQNQMDSTGPGGMFRQMRARAMDEVSKVVTTDQQEAFEQWRAIRESDIPPPLIDNPDGLKNALKAIPTLTDIQKNSLEAAFQRYDTQRAAPGADEPLERNKIRNDLISTVQRTLKPGQQILMMSSFRQQMRQQFQARNASQPGQQDGANGNPRGSAVLPGAQATASQQSGATAAPPAQPNPLDTDEWSAYVRTFVSRHNLDDLQRDTAYDILQELRTRRDIYLSSHRRDMQDLDKKAKTADPQQRSAIEEDRKALQQPIAEMFQELKDRLDTLAPETTASSQASTTSQPAASRPAATSRPTVAQRRQP